MERGGRKKKKKVMVGRSGGKKEERKGSRSLERGSDVQNRKRRREAIRKEWLKSKVQCKSEVVAPKLSSRTPKDAGTSSTQVGD